MNDDFTGFFVFAVLILIVIFLFYFFNTEAKIKRKFKNANPKKIGDFKNGEVAKLLGVIHSVDDYLIAPLSGRQCVQYHVTVEKKTKSNNGGNWHTLINDTNACKFLIRDENHHAMINDSNIKSLIFKDAKYSSGFLKDANPMHEHYLKSHDLSSENFLGMNKTLRYKEGILERDEEVAVLGMGHWKPASHFDIPESYNNILEITSYENEPIYISDHKEVVSLNKETKYVRIKT